MVENGPGEAERKKERKRERERERERKEQEVHLCLKLKMTETPPSTSKRAMLAQGGLFEINVELQKREKERVSE